MVNQNQIQRLIELRSYRRLIERLLPETRCRSDQAAQELVRPECAAASAIGLALLRLCELAYVPSATTRNLAVKLSGLRRTEGLFGDAAAPSVGPSAVALRAMSEWRDLVARAGHATTRLDEATARSLAALAALQSADGLLGGDPVGSAIALAMLGDVSAFRAAVDVPKLAAAIDRCRTINLDLHDYAHAMAA